jgi:arylsulfatase A-like enzyme
MTLFITPRLPLAAGVTGRPVILVSLDTLRADRVGFLGGARRLTPRLDELALEGAVFEQAQSAAPWTLPSHASVFTSLLPYDHGCRWDHDAMRPRHVTLAERFWNAGYRTAAFTGGGYVSAKFGFDHGFDVYEDHDEIREGGPEVILAAALRWVREHRNEPFFLFLHSYEIHAPLRRGDLADPRDAGRLPDIIGGRLIDAMNAGQLVLTPGERRYVADYYDGGVAHADETIGGFLEALRREGVLDRAILMVISDHGEELWERYPNRGPGHGHTLYQELQHVPWMVWAPGLVPAGRRVREPVTLLDLSPTLQELTGLPADASQAGVSLADALLHGIEPARREIVMESVEFGPERFAMREGNYKVILTPDPDRFDKKLPIAVPPLQVFDLAADPGEQVDLAERMEDAPRGMTRTLFDRFRQVPRAPGDDRREADLPADLRRQLESLGYLH